MKINCRGSAHRKGSLLRASDTGMKIAKDRETLGYSIGGVELNDRGWATGEESTKRLSCGWKLARSTMGTAVPIRRLVEAMTERHTADRMYAETLKKEWKN